MTSSACLTVSESHSMAPVPGKVTRLVVTPDRDCVFLREWLLQQVSGEHEPPDFSAYGQARPTIFCDEGAGLHGRPLNLLLPPPRVPRAV
jgi:hypothetical protein